MQRIEPIQNSPARASRLPLAAAWLGLVALPVACDSAASASPPGPRIQFEQLAHDFGQVSDIGTLNNSFAFRNVGDRQLVITEVKPACGCTTTQLAKKTYEPGEAGLIESQWQAKGFGRQKKTITVQTNGEPERTVLSISAKIDPFVSFSPSYLSFGQLDLGQEKSVRAELLCADEELEVLSVSSPSSHVAAVYLVDDDGQPGLLVTILPSAPWGALTASIAIEVRGRPGGTGEVVQHRAELGVRASIFSDLRVDLSLFAVGRVDPGASFSSEVQLIHQGGQPFEIVELSLAKGARPSTMSVRSEPLTGADTGYRLIVEGEAGGYLGLIRGSVSFRTDVEGEPARRLAVMGIVRARDPGGH